MKITSCILGLTLCVATRNVSAFAVQRSVANALSTTTTTTTTALSSAAKGEESTELDVSALGLTMDDLNAPLPTALLQGMETSGYQSTSRLTEVDDEGCFWTETGETVSATLAIPGLRGQPSACLAVLFSTTTISITAFGRVVWSAILRGTIDPETAKFDTEDGAAMIPVVNLSFQKVDTSRRWDGMILQIGEDSLI